MDHFTSSHCLCTLPNPCLWFYCHLVLLGTLYFIPTCPILYSLRITWPWRRCFRSTSTRVLRIITDVSRYIIIIWSRGGPAIAEVNNRVHSLEKHNVNINRELVLHFILDLPNSSVLAISIYLFCMVDWISSTQAFASHEKIWLQPKGFLIK